jgi:hypothetical protein
MLENSNVIDGRHRLAKLIDQHAQSVPAIRLSPEDINQSIVKQSEIYVGDDAHHTKEDVQKKFTKMKKNYPDLPQDWDPDILHGTGQFWRDLKRYYVPKKLSEVPRTLAKIPASVVPSKYLPEDMGSLRTVLSEAGRSPDNSNAYLHTLFKTVNLPEERIDNNLFAHELGHSLQDEKKLPYKTNSDFPFKHKYTGNYEDGYALNNEMAATINAGRFLQKLNDKQIHSLRMATYLRREAFDNPSFGMREDQERIKPDKNWQKNMKNWNTLNQFDRERLLSRGIEAEIDRTKHDPYSNMLKHPPGPKGDYLPVLLDKDMKGVVTLAKHLINTEEKRMNKQSEYRLKLSLDKWA